MRVSTRLATLSDDALGHVSRLAADRARKVDMTGNFAALISGFMYLRLRYRHCIEMEKKKKLFRKEVEQEVTLHS